jgi:hypothetical protein
MGYIAHIAAVKTTKRVGIDTRTQQIEQGLLAAKEQG